MYRANAAELAVRAREEVILAAGAINSPQLLELTGIGRPDGSQACGMPSPTRSPASARTCRITCSIARVIKDPAGRTLNTPGRGSEWTPASARATRSPPDFDSMIAKIIAFGRDRDEALARLRRAMQETTVVIEGGSTNKSFVLDLLSAPEVIDGSADTGWIDRVRAEGGLVAHRHSGVALVAAGIEAYETEEALERTRLIETARGGRPQVQHRTGQAIDLKLRGNAYKVTVFRTGPQRFRVVITNGADEQAVDAEIDRLDAYKSRLTVGGSTHRLVTAAHGPIQLVEVDGVTHRVSLDEGGVLRSPAPALVVATPAAVGGEVAAGAPVLVLESMKMETVLNAPFAGRIRELLVSTGSQVETGAPLVRLEPVGDVEEVVAESEGIDLELPGDGAPSSDPEPRAETRRRDLYAVLRGYDVDPSDNGNTLTAYLADRDQLVADGRSPLAGELSLLEAFADFADISRNRPAGEDRHLENQVHSPREHFHTYLRSLDPDRGALPDDFRDKLLRVLRHYGVTDLDHTPELERAVFRVFLAQQRWAPDVQLATSILQRWIGEQPPAPQLEQTYRDVLDRLVAATQLRFPVVGELARSVRFRWYDQPLVDAERQSVLDSVAAQLVTLTGMPPGPSGTPSSTCSPPSPSRSSASSPTGSTAAPSPRTNRCSRC